MGINVGIDLGTTFSAVARISPQTGRAEIIKNHFGETITPSVLYFNSDGSVLFGEEAKQLQQEGDTNSVAFFKRNMGNGMYEVTIYGKKYTAADFSSILLKKLKETAEEVSGQKIDGAVITVPAYFTDIERSETMKAGRAAGLNVLAIINEPTAAAFAYGLNETKKDQTILIYDLGGGTFDVTVARINSDTIDVLGSDGDHKLGGKDWDDCIAAYICDEFEKQTNVSFADDAEMVNSILVLAENAKKQLSAMNSVRIPVNYKGSRAIINLDVETLEDISSFLMGTTASVIDRLFDSIGITWNNIDGVILVGGSTRMKMVQNYVRLMSGKEPLRGVNVDEAVALGAAIRANIVQEYDMLSGKPARRSSEQILSIAGAKKVRDVTAHSMGMISQNKEGDRYINSIIIPKNSKIPSSESRTYQFRTGSKNNEMEVYVVQGEYKRPLDNVITGMYSIQGIEKTSPPVTNIEVTYQYTSDGIIEVSAVQKETQKSLKVIKQSVPDDMSWTDLDPRDHAEGGNAPANIEVILSIDLSGSMYFDHSTPIHKATEAMLQFVSEMSGSEVRIGLMAFADRHKLLIEPTDNYEKLNQKIRKISDVNVGACNKDQPFTEGYRYFSRSDADVKYMIVLTDGVWSRQEHAIKEAKKCHAAGIEVMALGFGSADAKFLKAIASTDSFASLTDLNELSGSFSKIAQEIGSSGITALD